MKVSTGGSSFNINVGVVPQFSQAEVELKNFLKKAEQTSEIKLDVVMSSNGKKAIKYVKTEMGDLVRVTKQYDSAGQLIETRIDRLSRDYQRLTRNLQQTQQAQQNLNNTTQRGVSAFKDFAATFMKMVKFNTINLIYDGFINKMSEAIEITNEFDKAMTEFKKVTDTSSLSLSEYTEKLGELGDATARSATQMLEAATEFSKSGFTADESARLAQVATQ